MKASYKKYTLNFKRPSGTSRGVLTTKETWFLILEEENNFGIGECGILRTLSIDDRPDYEEKLKWTCQNIHLPKDELLAELVEFPSIQFGVEMALLSLHFSHKIRFNYFLQHLRMVKRESRLTDLFGWVKKLLCMSKFSRN